MSCFSEGTDCEGYLDPWSLLNAFKRKSMSLGVDYITGEATDFIQDQNGKISGVQVCLGLFFKHVISGAVSRVSLLGSLSNHDDESNKHVTTNYACKICYNYPGIKLEPALQRKEDKIEYLSSYDHVVHATAKQVISRHGKNENFCEMFKNEKCTCKACNTIFHCKICKFMTFVLPSSSWLLKLPYNVKLLQQREETTVNLKFFVFASPSLLPT